MHRPDPNSSNRFTVIMEPITKHLLIEERWKALMLACKMSREMVEEEGKQAIEWEEKFHGHLGQEWVDFERGRSVGVVRGEGNRTKAGPGGRRKRLG